MMTLSKLTRSYKKYLPLLATVLLTAPIIFLHTFRYSFPLGYAGMFTLIAERIAGANFRLPMSIPHYGPGGIPLVYPPLGMYVFALAIKMGISTWLYLRVVPAVFTLLAVIPLYYLTLELFDSRTASVLAVVLAITAPPVYYTHVWSAGVIRALALCFCLAGLLFYLRSLRNFSWHSFLLAGIFLGLVFLTHWLYVVFAALVGLACLIADWKPSRLPAAFGILIVAMLVAAPWWIVILGRHEMSTVLMASSSHRNVDFFMSLKNLSRTTQFIRENLQALTDNWFVTALAFAGFILLVIRRKFHIPLAFLFILTMGEASFYAEILAAMMAGAFMAEIFRLTPGLVALKNANSLGCLKLALSIVASLCFLLSTLNGLSQISHYQPMIDKSSLQTASFVRENTEPDTAYLFIGRINEAEWFPYLSDRTPVFGPWGSEWKGTYAGQSEIVLALRACETQRSWACMEDIQQKQSVSPRLLIIPNWGWLIQQIRETHTWDLLYKNERYLVWERID
jgi:hypothetical protein